MTTSTETLMCDTSNIDISSSTTPAVLHGVDNSQSTQPTIHNNATAWVTTRQISQTSTTMMNPPIRTERECTARVDSVTTTHAYDSCGGGRWKKMVAVAVVIILLSILTLVIGLMVVALVSKPCGNEATAEVGQSSDHTSQALYQAPPNHEPENPRLRTDYAQHDLYGCLASPTPKGPAEAQFRRDRVYTLPRRQWLVHDFTKNVNTTETVRVDNWVDPAGQPRLCDGRHGVCNPCNEVRRVTRNPRVYPERIEEWPCRDRHTTPVVRDYTTIMHREHYERVINCVNRHREMEYYVLLGCASNGLLEWAVRRRNVTIGCEMVLGEIPFNQDSAIVE